MMTTGTRPRGIPRVSLVSGRTGVPLFLLFLEQGSAGHRELHSLEHVERLCDQAGSPLDAAAWKSVETFFLAGGSEAHALVLPLPAEKNRLREMVGREGGVGRRTGVQCVRDWVEKADLLVIPQATELLSSKEYALFVQKAFEILSGDLGIIFLVDLPCGFDAGEAEHFTRKCHSADAAVFHPWILTEQGAVPPSAVIAGWLQRTDQEASVAELSPRSLRPGWQPLRSIGAAERARLLEARINTFLVHQGQARPWGGYTLADRTEGQDRLIPLRRTSLQIRRAVEEICEPFVLEAVDSELPVWVDHRLKNFLRSVRRLFHPDRAEPFSTKVEVVQQGGEDKLQVGVSYALPHSTERFSFSFIA